MQKRDNKSQTAGGWTRHHTRKQVRDKQDPDHHKKKHHHPQADQHDNKQDETKSSDRPHKTENGAAGVESADDPSSNAQTQQPVQPPNESTPLQPPTSSNSDLQAPAIAPDAPQPQTQRISAPEPASHSTTPSIPVIAGAVLGGVVLLLALVSLVAYKCSRRKKASTRSKQVARHAVSQSPWASRTDLMGNLSDSQYASFRTDDCQQQWPYLQRDRSRTVSEQDHVKVSLPSEPLQGEASVVHREHGPGHISKPNLSEQSGVELAQLSAVPQETPSHLDHNLLGEPSLREAETTFEGGDDTQIDRCLSYYMKRRTVTSMHPEAPSALPSPLPPDLDHPPSPSQNSALRRSFKFAKTANLLEKIRRSQIRLNDEALSKARSEGFRFSRAPDARVVTEEPCPSSASSANSTEATKYDVSSSFSPENLTGAKIPAHWRPHSHLQKGKTPAIGDQDNLGSSPASEPHSAFEYAEYYDTYLPGAVHTSGRAALTANDAEDGYALPWSNHSPCRSSALSPRRSENASMRQRSATFSQGSPLAWPESASLETDDAASKSHLSGVSCRESAQVDEVIRF